ncbi:MAG: isoprenylcysteine carboxylmethyltransferase family protein [Candidatus Thermoplasmatota archaeon]|nr:isoprenylcysteine carboxylmethyltransferase family protein [Candidatus Thermoplasmatota archaeon]
MSWIPAFELGIWNAWIFMIWQIIIPILLVFIVKEKTILKKLSTSVPVKFEKTSNILSMVILIVAFIYSIFLPLQLNTLWLYLGVLIFLFGLIIDVMALYTFREAKPDGPFTTGPYRYSRHPVYFGFFLMYISISLMTLSWIFLVITIIFGIHFLIVAPAEERYCLQTYGKEYKEYMERTPRYIGLSKSKK